jgi:hypothetical protein
MNEIEKSLEISNVFSDTVSLFRHQVPGVENGLHVSWHDKGQKKSEKNTLTVNRRVWR